MNPTTIANLAAAVAGRCVNGADAPIETIVTDARQATPGAAFVALRGETHDGHAFVADAIGRGASVAIVDREMPGAPTIVVADTRQALRDLGAHVRDAFGRCRVVGVAGSNGKTSTKYLIRAALGSTLRGTASPKSFNNDIGVPLAIFDADPSQDFCVLELGTNHHGEIHTLARIARPDVCVITNCTAEHLEGLTDLDGVRRENASVIDGMTDSGTLVVLGDDPLLLDAVGSYRGTLVRFGHDAANDLVATDVQVAADGTRFKLEGRRVHVPMIGRHNALNALAAIAVARCFGVADGDAIAGLAASTRPEMRLDRREAHGVVVLDDAYNANPASMRGAIETLLSFGGRRVAVLGEMREMGDHSERLHRELGALIAERGDAIARLVCVGPMSRWIADAAACGLAGRIDHFDESSEAAEAIEQLVQPRDVVLVKGSRGVRMERIVERLLTPRVKD